MKYTLSQAATATGNNKATIQRAIKSGKISAKKNSSGAYEIDPSELHRIFPATAQRAAQQDISNDKDGARSHCSSGLSLLLFGAYSAPDFGSQDRQRLSAKTCIQIQKHTI
jgi:hypothetical protein